MEHLRIDRLTPPPRGLLSAAAGPVVARCHRARSARARLIGLLGTPDLRPDEGLWLEPCRSVHTAALRARIGCAFLDADGRVLRVVDPLPRWRVRGLRAARAVVECRAGVLARIAPGDRLMLGHAAAAPHLPSRREPPQGGESRAARASCLRRARRRRRRPHERGEHDGGCG